MRHGRMRGRGGASHLLWCAALWLAAGQAEAEEKKKPGLFDFDVWKSPAARERDDLKHFAPHSLDLTPAVDVGGEPRTVRIRIYADRDHRGVVLHWQAKARAQIERVNAVVRPLFNIRFEVEGFREWDKSHFGVELGAVTHELEALDPAREVDWVIGLATPMRGVATSLHAIGNARYCSRHFVLRGMDDEQEILALEREFKLISVEERQRFYADRKAHKEVVVFLHEWGHTMGLVHHEDRAIVMNPAYDSHQRAFSAFEKEVIALVLERRLAHPREAYPESADLAALLASAPADEGTPDERAHVAALVRDRGRPGNANPAGAAAGDGAGTAVADLPAAEVEALNRAVTALNNGRAEEAWTLLAPVVRGAGARQTGAATWGRLAGLAAAIGAFSAAEEAVAKAGNASADAREVAAAVDAERHRLALPPNAAKFGIPPEKEPAYVARYWKTAEAVKTTKPVDARARLRELAEAFPGAPGVDVLACDLELRAKRAAQASKSCEAALEKFKGATRAHYLLGVIAANGRRGEVAEQHFRKVILMDPKDETAWRALASIYRSTGAKQRLAQLASEHQALLFTPLPN